jgi:hypothetical protein
MKKLFYSLAMFSMIFAFFSCNNSTQEVDENKDDEKTTEETTKLEIKTLEDVLNFENHEQIVEYFGEENVVKTQYTYEEGTVTSWVTVVYPNNKNSLVISWKDESCDKITSIQNSYSSYTNMGELADDGGIILPIEAGVELGSTLPEIKEANGKEFTFYGLSWDYGGYVTNLNEKFDGYTIHVGWPEGDVVESWPDEYYDIIGDKEFSSENESALKLGLEIMDITYEVR